MNRIELSDSQQLRIVIALLTRPDRPKDWALWWEGGQLWERTGLQGKPDRLSWSDAVDMVGMRTALGIQPASCKPPIRQNRRSVREIQESLRRDLERLGMLPATNSE